MDEHGTWPEQKTATSKLKDVYITWRRPVHTLESLVRTASYLFFVQVMSVMSGGWWIHMTAACLSMTH